MKMYQKLLLVWSMLAWLALVSIMTLDTKPVQAQAGNNNQIQVSSGIMGVMHAGNWWMSTTPDASSSAAANSITLSAMNAGGTNNAGASVTFNAGQGTGNAAGGRMSFATAFPGSSGTNQNTLNTDYTLSGGDVLANGHSYVSNTSAPSGWTDIVASFSVGTVQKSWVDSNGIYNMLYTLTPGGTTGNVVINKPSGSVRIAAGGNTVTVTNSTVTANSIVMAVASTNDATAYVKNVVPHSGSFDINLGANATAETEFRFTVTNQ